MSLPVPNLDNRQFQDIVDEAKRLIPRLVPEWTNHNVSDPGVALIELFAWMTDLTLFRLNQVPDRLYTQFLNLLGMSPFPSRAAVADLTFWIAAVPPEQVRVPKGTEVATAGERPFIFVTQDDLTIVQPKIEGALTGFGEEGLTDVLRPLNYDRDTVTCFASDPIEPGDCFYLGFDHSLASEVIELQVTTAESGVGVDPKRAPAQWEAWSGTQWSPCEVHLDTTGGLNRSGSILLLLPRKHDTLTLLGQRRHWIRIRLLATEPGRPTYRTSPKLATITAICRGGTVSAEHSERVQGTLLGRSTAVPGQFFDLPHRPILPPVDGEHVVASLGDDAQVWTMVDDFADSGPMDRHYVLDQNAGRVQFGPVVRYDDGRVVQHGAVPANGALITMTAYRHGGGEAANVGARTIINPRGGLPFIDRVENLKPARGGVDPESVDNVKVRAPMSLRSSDRAVTAADYERLTLEATTEVARARCLAPTTAGRPVRVLVVPKVSTPPETTTIDHFQLSDSLFDTISTYLEPRRVLGAAVEIAAPYYIGVSVAVLVRAGLNRQAAQVRQTVLDALYTYLSPFEGGPDGTGWPWDTTLTTAALVGLVGALDGVAGVDELAMFEVNLRTGKRVGDSSDSITLDRRTLVLGSHHRVVVR